jgi:hypothetical protein
MIETTSTPCANSKMISEFTAPTLTCLIFPFNMFRALSLMVRLLLKPWIYFGTGVGSGLDLRKSAVAIKNFA